MKNTISVRSGDCHDEEMPRDQAPEGVECNKMRSICRVDNKSCTLEVL